MKILNFLDLNIMIRPDPPVVGKVTHVSIDLDWSHVKKDSPYAKLKFIVQELSNNNKREWGIIYS